jgi:5'-nucleotidase / UDP-sugar diphosphatase
MRTFALLLILALPLCAETRVTLLHFSDYHSHALPFYTDEGEQGGIARAIGYLRGEKRKGALVFSGGDTVNRGAPAWSDKYGCAEWPWFNGIVDAMALGNHDPDYGREAFDRCLALIKYPLLSANTGGFDAYRVYEVHGKRIGVFALAGDDFAKLVKTPGFVFEDSIAAAQRVVRELRGREKVDAVVMIGHEHVEADYALARAVPGIDLIFGSHSHLKRELSRIPDTNTWFISPSQYVTYISRVELVFSRSGLRVSGALVPVDSRMKPDRLVTRWVKTMQRDLENDPRYRDLFTPLGTIEQPLSIAALGQKTVAVMRLATKSDVALSTASSFRQPLPRGALTMELLLGALPYENEIVTCTMSGVQVQRLLEVNASRKGSDSEAYVDRPATIDPAAAYRVATTDYMANVGWKDSFDCQTTPSGLKVREELKKALTKTTR